MRVPPGHIDRQLVLAAIDLLATACDVRHTELHCGSFCQCIGDDCRVCRNAPVWQSITLAREWFAEAERIAVKLRIQATTDGIPNQV